jgi:hypothetical protein
MPKKSTKKGTLQRGVGRTAFVPTVVFRTVFKAAVPVVSGGMLPACLAVSAFDGDASREPDGFTLADASISDSPSASDADAGSDSGSAPDSGSGSDAGSRTDGADGATDAASTLDSMPAITDASPDGD